MCDEVIELEALLSPMEKIIEKLNKLQFLSQSEIFTPLNDQGWDLTFYASEIGHEHAMEEILKIVKALDFEINGETLASVAFKNHHHSIVLQLLRANAKYPNNFSKIYLSDKLRNFVEISVKLHKYIEEDSVENVKEIILNNSDLKYFYDLENNSALSTAIRFKRFEIYEILLQNNFKLALHENLYTLLSGYSNEEKKKFHKIQLLDFDNIENLTDQELFNYMDIRIFNCLMIAAENGYLNAVKNILSRNIFAIDYEKHENSAASLAFTNNHFDVLLVLLEANAKYPNNFNVDVINNEALNNFIKNSNSMHEFVKSGNVESIKNILEIYPNLKYFYDLNNKSTIVSALEHKQFPIYELLCEHNLSYGSHENIKEILISYNQDDVRQLRKIQQMNFEKVSQLDDNVLTNYHDIRGYNALMIAAENGYFEAVNNFIERGLFLYDYEIEGETASSLAYSNSEWNILHTLLQANAQFPKNFQLSNVQCDLIKQFVNVSVSMHQAIKANDCKKVEEIILANQNLRHFYDLQNNSAFKIALKEKKFEVYKTLVENDVIVSPNEDYDEIRKCLSEEEQLELTAIQVELSKSLTSPTILTLMSNSFFGGEKHIEKERRTLAADAYEFLLNLPLVAIILKIVATAKNYKIIFDFKNDSIQYLDFTAEPYMSGTFYTSGRILIAAKNLFNDDRKYEVYGILAHELCHFAMFLTYDNFAKPYKVNDEASKELFQNILDTNSLKADIDDIIRAVYANYGPDQQHAELIVRVPQMIAHYDSLPELDERREQFESLFDFYEKNCVPEMERVLPELEKKKNYTEKDKKISQQRKYIFALGVFLCVGTIISLLVAWWLYTPMYSWDTMTSEQRDAFNEAPLNFHGVSVKFRNLFSNDSEIYDKLVSDHIRHGLRRDEQSLSQAILPSFEHYIHLNWNNMTKQLQDSFLSRKVKFQGENIRINKILVKKMVLTSLPSDKTLKIFNNIPINISSSYLPSTNIFVERSFILENIEEQSEHYVNYMVNKNNKNILKFEEIVKNIEHINTFLLSNKAGEGKSTIFIQLAKAIKKAYPDKWVEYLDLKHYVEAFKKGKRMSLDNPTNLVKYLSEEVFKLNAIEKQIFNELFSLNRTVFFWDGIDEISPLYKDFALRLISIIKDMTKNSQLISMRPQYSQEFQGKLHIKSHKLVQFGKYERFQLLIKSILLKYPFVDSNSFWINIEKQLRINDININALNLTKELNAFDLKKDEDKSIIDAVHKGVFILTTFETSKDDNRLLTNPLLIKMISDIVNDEAIQLDSKINFYTIFRMFLNKKMDLLFDKGSSAREYVGEAFLDSKINVMQIHQAYALKVIFEDFIRVNLNTDELKINITQLEIMNSISKTSHDRISRFGIVQVNSDSDFNFAHQTFAEFLVAQFLIDSSDNLKSFNWKNHDKFLKALFLNAALFDEKYGMIRKFITNYVHTDANFTEIFYVIREQLKNDVALRNITQDRQVLKMCSFAHIYNFFKSSFDNELVSLLTFEYVKWNDNSINEFINKWTEIENVIGKQMIKSILSTRGARGLTYFNVITKSASKKVFERFVRTIENKFSQLEIKELVSFYDIKKENSLMYAARYQREKELNIFFNAIENSFQNKSEFKVLLETKSSTLLTVFDYSMWNKDPKSFSLIFNIYQNYYNDSEIRFLFAKMFIGYLPPPLQAIPRSSLATLLEVWNFMQIYFNGTMAFNIALEFRDIEGHSVFSKFNQEENKMKLQVLDTLFYKTAPYFKEQNRFQHIRQSLSNPSFTINHFFSMFDEERCDYDLIADLKLREWFATDFVYFIRGFNHLVKLCGKLSIKNLLLKQHPTTNRTMLHDLALNRYGRLMKEFTEILNDTLAINEQVELFMVQDIYGKSALMYAVRYEFAKNNKVYFLNYFEQIKITDNDFRRILEIRDNDYYYALQHSALNEMRTVFSSLFFIYSKYFYREQLQKMVTSHRDVELPFISDIIKYSNVVTANNVAVFLHLIFNDILELRSFLSSRDKNGETIFNLANANDVKTKEKINIFKKTLENTFQDKNEFDIYFETLVQSNKVQTFLEKLDYETFKNAKLFHNDFDQILKNVNNFEKSALQKLFKSVNGEDESFLFDFVRYGDENLIIPLFELITDTLDSNHINSLLFKQNTENKTILMLASSLRQKEFLQTFYFSFLHALNKEKINQILGMTDSFSWTALHYSISNVNENAFKYVSEIYKNHLEKDKLQEIILKNSKILQEIVKVSNIINTKQFSDFLKTLFDNKIMLRNFLTNSNENGETCFSIIPVTYEERQAKNIFEKLLKTTFDDVKEFDIFWSKLEISNTIKHYFESSATAAKKKIFIEEDFWEFTTNWEEFKSYLGPEKFRNVLKSKDQLQNTLFHDLCKFDIDTQILQSFLELVPTTLSPSDIKEILESFDKTENALPLMNCCKYLSELNLRIFWTFLEETFEIETLKNLLLLSNSNSLNSLKNSMYNSDPSSFLFISKLYDNFFLQQTIQDMFTQKTNNSLISVDFLKSHNKKTAYEVSYYLKSLFHDDKLQLRDYLARANSEPFLVKNQNQTIKEYEIFNELLSNTFGKDAKQYYNLYNAIHNLKKGILKFNGSNENNFEENYSTNKNYFLSNASHMLNLLIIPKYRIETLEEILKENELKEILSASNHYDSHLHVSMLNDNITHFVEISKLYKSCFSNKEIQKILTGDLECEPYGVELVLQGHTNTLSKVLDFLKEIFETNVSELYQFLTCNNVLYRSYLDEFKNNYQLEERLHLLESFISDINTNTTLITTNENIKKLFNFDAISRSKIWLRDKFNYLLLNWENIKLKLGIDRFIKFLKSTRKLETGDPIVFKSRFNEERFIIRVNQSAAVESNVSLLHEIVLFKENNIFIYSFLEKLRNTLSKEDIVELLDTKERFQNETALMWASEYLESEYLSQFLNFINGSIDRIDVRDLLNFSDSTSLKVIHHSMFNPDTSSFKLMKDFYQEYFSVNELQNLTSDCNSPFIIETFKVASPRMAFVVSKFLVELFQNNKIMLRKLLTMQENNVPIFSTLNDDDDNQTKKGIMIALVKGSFYDNETHESTLFLNSIMETRMFPILFNDFKEGKLNQTITQNKNLILSFNDLTYMIENFEQLNETSQENFKLLLMSTYSEENNIFHAIFGRNLSENLLENALKNILNTFNKNEILSLLQAKNSYQDTPLMYGVGVEELSNIKILWKFLEKTFTAKEIKEILIIEDQLNLTALHYSTANKNFEVFSFLNDCYKVYFSIDDIRDFFYKALKTSCYFFVKLVESDPSLEKFPKILEYLADVLKLSTYSDLKNFTNCSPNDLGKMLFTVKKGNTPALLNYLEYITKYKIESGSSLENDNFIFTLLKKGPLQQKIPSRVKFWQSKEFDFFFNNWNQITKNFENDDLKKFISSKVSRTIDQSILNERIIKKRGREQSINLLQELMLIDENSTNIIPFIEKLKTVGYNKTELYDLIQNPSEDFNETSVMWAAEFLPIKELKYFWNFLNESLDEKQVEDILKTRNELNFTMLHFSAMNSDPNSFIFIQNMFLRHFGNEETKVFFNSGMPFLFIIQNGSLETNIEVAKFIKKLFNAHKSEIYKFLNKEITVNKNEKRTVFEIMYFYPKHQEKINSYRKILEI